MKLTIEVRLVCPDCERVGIKSAHGTTPEECARFRGLPCDHPDEHHPARLRRPKVTLR